MMDVKPILKQLSVDPRAGRIRAVQAVGEQIMSNSNPIGFANTWIVKMGGVPQQDFPTARIILKSLVEQAVSGDAYCPEKAMVIAGEKVEKLRKDLPWCLEQSATSMTSTLSVTKPKRVAKKNGDLKEKALKICRENSSLSNGDLAKIIQNELSITYANAYYYSSRVFKR